jgi:hypothetical protein
MDIFDAIHEIARKLGIPIELLGQDLPQTFSISREWAKEIREDKEKFSRILGRRKERPWADISQDVNAETNK